MSRFSPRLRAAILALVAACSAFAGWPGSANADDVPFDGAKSAWHDGFVRHDYVMDDATFELQPFQRDAAEKFGIKDPPKGKHRCVVIVPRQPAAGNPWSWRGCYWDHEPQTEVELLRRGFHVAYISANATLRPGKQWEAWYAFLTEKHGLSKKPAFVGMSRGGEYAYTWAVNHPTQVACIYADNPGISAEVLGKLGPLAVADVPVLHVCGSIDPLLERCSNAIENIYRSFGGRISVMIKEGAGHHPHSLRDPGPIADFIVASVHEKAPQRPDYLNGRTTHTNFYGVENAYRPLPKESTYALCRGPFFAASYDRWTFELKGVEGAITVIVPREPVAGKPWAFRADPARRDSAVDLGLLAKGIHIVTGPISYNADKPSLAHWNAVYKHLVEHGFSKKPVLGGIGAAAGEAYAWAIANPDKVSCIYAENPILRCKMTKAQPLDGVADLAKSGVPLLHFCGELDPMIDSQSHEAQKRVGDKGRFVLLVEPDVGHVAPSSKTASAVVEFVTRSLVLTTLSRESIPAESFVQTQPKTGKRTRERVIDETMKPFEGVSNKGVDCSTMTGKVLCGYQGWHAAEGDGLGRGWYHWTGRNGFKPGSTNVDLWPDVTELGPDERYATAFKLADGKPAEVYSAQNAKTVSRHFQWMRDYGIDGVFVQRFAGEVFNPPGLRQFNTVLANCREGANKFGRTYAVMYDLSGMRAGQMGKVIDDWKLLTTKMQITKDPAYLHHAGHPVVAVWGFGFSDGRKYTLQEGLDLVAFLKSKEGGECTVMLGVPTYWRTLERDTVKDETLHELIRKADIVSPWTVGRFGTAEQATKYAEKTMTPDIAWCDKNGKEYLPVVFPGFSWHNMNAKSPTNQIPRKGGQFLWSQFAAAKKAGAKMVYQAMFDEVDEGTAIYKCTNDVPVGASTFLTYEGLPSDHYLKVVGTASRMIRGELPWSAELPTALQAKKAD